MKPHWTVVLLPIAWLTTTALAQDPPAEAARAVHKLALGDKGEVEVTAAWDDIAESKYQLHAKNAQLQGFRPAQEKQRYATSAFRVFLPQDPVAVGEVWKVDASAAVSFLKQLHKGATAQLHHGWGSAPGAWGCLRAISPTHAEVFVRLHAEFALVPAGEEHGPSWLTPSQFAGRLVVDLAEGKVESFHLFVPPINTNVDVNIPMKSKEGTPQPGFLADIGFMPRMELTGGATGAAERRSYAATIEPRDAEGRLERAFYRSASVGWLPVPDAVRAAQAKGIPLHVVVLFGALEDESC